MLSVSSAGSDVIGRTWPLGPNAPKGAEIHVRSVARSRSVGFRRTAPASGSWARIKKKKTSESEAEVQFFFFFYAIAIYAPHVAFKSTHMYSVMGAWAAAGAGGCRLLWLPMLLL